MSHEEADAEVLSLVARRLFSEGRAIFQEAHVRGMQSFNAPTMGEHLSEFEKALRQERLALRKQGEACLLHAEALRLRVKGLARQRAARGGRGVGELTARPVDS